MTRKHLFIIFLVFIGVLINIEGYCSEKETDRWSIRPKNPSWNCSQIRYDAAAAGDSVADAL